MRPKWEKLVGDISELDYLATLYGGDEPGPPHPLQDTVEQIITEELTDDEKEVFYMRFGEGMTIRAIAEAQGYNSHYVIQWKLESIMEKVRRAIEQD